MTLVGKKLQDIYDSGAETLSELQEKAANDFKKAGKEHAQSMQQLAETSSVSLQDKSSNLQTELKKLMQASLEKLENVLSAESDQNQVFVRSLVAELQTRTEQMKSKLVALGQSHQENVDFAFNVARQHYLSNLETTKIGLDETAAQCATEFTEYGATATDKLLQTIELTFWQQHEQCEEAGGTFFVSARQQEGAVSDHASILTQTLTNDCQNRLAATRTLANKATEEIEASIRSLLETITKHAAIVEKENNEKYMQLTDSHFQAVDARLSNFADVLSSLHDGITEQLLKETEEFSADLLSASTQTQDGLHIKCDKAVSTVDSDFNNFKQRLDARLQLSRGQKQTLEDDKNKILIAIKNELLSIYDSFSKKIATLSGSAKSELTEVTKSVEAKILAALETCNEQVGNSGTSVQKQIEDEVAAFLQTLSDSRTAAVDEISASAKGNSPMVNSPQSLEKSVDSEKVESINSFELNPYSNLKDQAIIIAETQKDTDSVENRSDNIDANTPKRVRRRKTEESE